jgi:hypothetical protein
VALDVGAGEGVGEQRVVGVEEAPSAVFLQLCISLWV